MRRIRFRFDGQPINEREAPAQLEMDDEDTNSRQGASSMAAASWGGGLPLEPPSPSGAGLCLLSNSSGVAKPIGRQAQTPRTFPRCPAPPRQRSPPSLGPSPPTFVWVKRPRGEGLRFCFYLFFFLPPMTFSPNL